MSEANRDEIARLEKSVAEQPDSRLFVHLAEAFRKSGEHDRALEVLDAGLAQHADYASAWIVRAQVLAESGRVDEAKESWRRVLELDGENEIALRTLGELEFNAGNSAESLRHFRRLAELNEEDHEALEMIAMIEDADSARLASQTEWED